MSFVRNAISDIVGGGDAADATLQAAQAQEGLQREALDYLRQIDQPLLDVRQEALPQLAGFFGFGPQAETAQTEMVERIQSSPFFDFNLQQAEEAILRNQAATGGLRSGATQRALGESAMNLSQNLLGQQLQGAQQFAFPPLSAGQQAGILQGIGQTQAQGILGAEQARQSAFGQGLGLIGNVAQGLASAGVFGAPTAAATAAVPTGSAALGASQFGYGPQFGFGSI